jgi:hypothetical protein
VSGFHRGGRGAKIILFVAAAAVLMGAAAGDVLYVARFLLPIRNGKFAFNKVVATAGQGDALTVRQVEGKWLLVRFTPHADTGDTTPIEGYILEDAVSARPVSAATTGPTAGAAADVGAAGAGKGLLLNAGRYASLKGLNPDPFYKMVVDSHSSFTEPMFIAFCKEGQIGPFKPGAGGGQ